MKVIKITQVKTSSVLYDSNGKIISRVREKSKTVEYVPYVSKVDQSPIKEMIDRFLKEQGK
jgi:predicted NBD/HSP70 family sugar kinase